MESEPLQARNACRGEICVERLSAGTTAQKRGFLGFYSLDRVISHLRLVANGQLNWYAVILVGEGVSIASNRFFDPAHQLIELPCAKLDLVLLARRSAAFAGTRFLKRGTNCDGFCRFQNLHYDSFSFSGSVANDVETEQIVWDSSSSMSFQSGKFSSFVQRRGSVPLFWSQDSIYRGAPMVVGKPPIRVDLVEPQALTTAKHFRDLGRKYGHPLIVLNLVKREEHRHNENLLHDIFLKVNLI